MKAREGLNLRRRVKRTKRQALVSLFPTPTNYSHPRLAKSKVTKPSKRSATTKKPKASKTSSRITDREDDTDDRPTIPKPAQRKLKKPSAKPPPTQTDDESDDLAIKGTKAPRKIDKGKARATESPPETFEYAGTDVDLEDSRSGPSNMKPLSAEERSLRDVPPDAYETSTIPIISRAAFDRGDTSDEEQKPKPPPKKRGRPRKDEGEGEPPPKRGKVQGASDVGDDEDSTRPKPKKQAKKPPSKIKSTVTKGRTRKKAPDDGSDEKEEDEQDGDGPASNPNRVRLDTIPPGGVVIRRGNGIVERLLPPVMYVQF